MSNKRDLRTFLIDWITAYKDGAERNALAETPKESADYLISQLPALIEIEGALREDVDEARIEIAELSKKLDDREIDLLEAVKQERERLALWGIEPCFEHSSEGIFTRRECPRCWQALKGG